MKRLLPIFIVINIIFSTFTTNAARLEILYQKVTEQTLSKSVKQTDYKMLSTAGWINANVVEADLGDQYLDLKPLFSDKGIANLTLTKTLAQQNNAIAAVNADFFAWAKASGKGSPIGLLVRDGKLLSTPANNNQMAALVQDKSKIMSIMYPSSYITVTAPNGESVVIKYINKFDALDNMVIYDNSFDKTSLGAQNGICEAVVTDGVLTEIRYDKEPFEIPNNAYVIAFLTDYSTFMYDNFKIGDKVALDIQMTPNLGNIKSAIGGGTQLVTQGQAAKITHPVSGAHPRTAVGIDKTGKKLFLITVDGRGESRGISLEALTEFMITLGVYDGLNFDGGGSTMMATRPLGMSAPSVANAPSENRAVANALAIVSTAPKGNLSGIIANPNQQYVFAGTSCAFQTYAYDEYYNPIELNQNEVAYTVSGVNGSFEGSTFKPKEEGVATITAVYKNVSTTAKITVLGQINSISVTPSVVDITNTADISITGKDKDGYSAPIKSGDLKITFDKKIAKIENNKITKIGDGDCIATLQFDKIKSHIAISSKANAKNIKLPKDVFITDYLKDNTTNETTFTVFGNAPKPVNLLQNLILKKSISKMNKFEKHFFVGDIDKSQLEGLNGSIVITNGYGDQTDKNSHYIWLNNRSGGLFETAKEQWTWLTEKISKTDKNNIFIFLPKDGFTNSLEEKAFFDVLKTHTIDKGKNCFVFSNNTTTNSQRIDGIRYITTGGLQGTSMNIFSKDMTQTKIVTVTINNNNVNYDFITSL